VEGRGGQAEYKCETARYTQAHASAEPNGAVHSSVVGAKRPKMAGYTTTMRPIYSIARSPLAHRCPSHRDMSIKPHCAACSLGLPPSITMKADLQLEGRTLFDDAYRVGHGEGYSVCAPVGSIDGHSLSQGEPRERREKNDDGRVATRREGCQTSKHAHNCSCK